MDAALIDFERQHAFLDPANFNQKNYRIDIIGAGATGSYVAFQLAKMGIRFKWLYLPYIEYKQST